MTSLGIEVDTKSPTADFSSCFLLLDSANEGSSRIFINRHIIKVNLILVFPLLSVNQISLQILVKTTPSLKKFPV